MRILYDFQTYCYPLLKLLCALSSFVSMTSLILISGTISIFHSTVLSTCSIISEKILSCPAALPYFISLFSILHHTFSILPFPSSYVRLYQYIEFPSFLVYIIVPSAYILLSSFIFVSNTHVLICTNIIKFLKIIYKINSIDLS